MDEVVGITDLLVPEDAAEIRATFAAVMDEVEVFRDRIGRGWQKAEQEMFDWDFEFPMTEFPLG